MLILNAISWCLMIIFEHYPVYVDMTICDYLALGKPRFLLERKLAAASNEQKNMLMNDGSLPEGI